MLRTSEFWCSTHRRFKLKPEDVPDTLDPAHRYLLQQMLVRRIPWSLADDTMRQGIYKHRSPQIAIVRRNLQTVLECDLAVVPLYGAPGYKWQLVPDR